MARLKEYYMDLEERYGDLVYKVEQIIDLYPELVKTKLLIKSLTDDLPKKIINLKPEYKLLMDRSVCRDELIQEMCEILSEDKHTNYIELSRYLNNKEVEDDPIY